MSDKRYTVIFDAKDKISSILDRFIRKSKDSEDAMKRVSRESDTFGKSASDQARRVDGAYNNLHSRLKVVDGAFLRMDDNAKRTRFTLQDMGGTPLSRLTDGLGGVISLLGGVAAGAVAAGGALSVMAAKGTFEHILKPAMEREQQEVTIKAILKDDALANNIMDDVKAQAQDSVFGVKEILGNVKGMLGFTKDRAELKDINNLTERIALTDSEQGFEGASYAMKQALSGDLVSLVDRFEMDRASFKNAGYKAGLSPQEYYQIINQVMNDKGYDQEFLDKGRGTAWAQWENLKSNVGEVGITTGKGMVEELTPYLKTLNSLFKQKDEMKKFTDSMSDRFKNMLKDVFKLGDGVDITWDDIQKWSEDTFDGVKKVMESTGGAFSTLLTLLSGGDISKPKDAFKNFGEVLEGVAKFIDKINDGLKFIGESIKSLESLDKWWADAKESGLATAMGLNADKKDKTYNEEYGIFKGPFKEMTDAWGKVDWSNLKPDWNPFENFANNVKKQDDIPLFGDNLFGHAMQSGGNMISGWATSMMDGSHANGLSYVPKDDYKANLHKGERVLTRSENQDYSKLMQSGTQATNSGVVINVTTMNVRSNEDIDAIGESIVMRLQARG